MTCFSCERPYFWSRALSDGHTEALFVFARTGASPRCRPFHQSFPSRRNVRSASGRLFAADFCRIPETDRTRRGRVPPADHPTGRRTTIGGRKHEGRCGGGRRIVQRGPLLLSRHNADIVILQSQIGTLLGVRTVDKYKGQYCLATEQDYLEPVITIVRYYD